MTCHILGFTWYKIWIIELNFAENPEIMFCINPSIYMVYVVDIMFDVYVCMMCISKTSHTYDTMCLLSLKGQTTGPGKNCGWIPSTMHASCYMTISVVA